MFLSLLLLSTVFLNVYGSAGDRNSQYVDCLNGCRSNLQCPGRADEYGWTKEPCFSCKYDCMWGTVELFRFHRVQAPQFHGKWPFVALRVEPFIVQEPASTIFSLANLFSVYILYIRVGTYVNLDSNNRLVWRRYCIVGMLTWISSTLFHCFDFWGTEYLDYFSASAFILAGFYVSVFFTNPQLSEQSSRIGGLLKIWLPPVLVASWIYHVYGMMNDFDYAYNMKLCVALALMTTALYVRFLWKRYRMGRFSSADSLLLLSILVLNGSVLLEQLDFVPFLWTIDAHSLFHLATVPVPIWFSRSLKMYGEERKLV